MENQTSFKVSVTGSELPFSACDSTRRCNCCCARRLNFSSCFSRITGICTFVLPSARTAAHTAVIKELPSRGSQPGVEPEYPPDYKARNLSLWRWCFSSVISRTVRLIYFTLGGCVAGKAIERSVEFGAIRTRNTRATLQV